MFDGLKRIFRTPKPAAPVRKSRKANFFSGFGERAQSGFNGGLHGGQIDRINENWRPGTVGPNQLFQSDGQLLRERAWDLYLNNPFAKSVIGAIIANVIECGIHPERDENWEKTWNRWGGLTPHSTRHCDLARDETIYGLQRTWLLEVIVGGGCLVHFVTVPRRSQEVPVAINLMTEEQFADHVTMFGRNPKTANPVKNAIEIDQATGRTLAFHIRNSHPNDLNFDPENVLRIPADQAHYGYMKWRAKAKRGTSLLRACVQWLFALGYYVDNELTASDIKSSFAAMIKTDRDSGLDWPDLLGDPGSSTTDVYGNAIDLRQKGTIFRGFPGDEIQSIGPNTPNVESAVWTTLIQRSIAIGAEVSLEEGFRHYEGSSLGVLRVIGNSDRKRFRGLQTFAIDHFCNPVVNRFDNTAVANFVEGFPSPSQWEMDRDDVWAAHEWTEPGWESPNPKDDAAADTSRLKDGTTTYKDVYGRRGGSWKRAFKQREIEAKTPGFPKPSAPVAQAPVEDDSEDLSLEETGVNNG